MCQIPCKLAQNGLFFRTCCTYSLWWDNSCFLYDGKMATTEEATCLGVHFVDWDVKVLTTFKYCAICLSKVSNVRPYFNKSSRQTSSQRAFRRTLIDLQCSASNILISLSTSLNSQLNKIDQCFRHPAVSLVGTHVSCAL